jgi:hypothetical protein
LLRDSFIFTFNILCLGRIFILYLNNDKVVVRMTGKWCDSWQGQEIICIAQQSYWLSPRIL